MSARPTTTHLATLIVEGKLICVPATQLDNLFDRLIEQEPNRDGVPPGRSFLFEDDLSQLNNIYSNLSHAADTSLPSDYTGRTP